MKNRVNWTQAFAEVALLVVGIGLALAADAWNEYRLDRVAEAEYLTALKGDFEQTRANFRRTNANNTGYRNHSLAMLNLLAEPPLTVPSDSLKKHAYTSFLISPFRPVLGTYFDMVNSGKMELLQSDSLRSALAQFETSLRWLDDNYREGFDQWNQIQAPFLVRNANARSFIGEEYAGIVSDLELPPSRFDADSDVFWTRELANIYVITALSREGVVDTGETAIRQIDEILRLIESSRE
ncbi:MAG: hypothetical protein HKO65_05335 [Gemmatimonadetes bacterium]|nr:hypothetical protein [Gemmatimonadota bacterium]NNM04506.1 hypothetical protein [Gemmatimonadota bacterium]